MSNDQDILQRSTPSYTQFNPNIIPYQMKVINLVKSWDYDKNGVLEILLSGSWGSAKSLLMAHLGVDHCVRHPRAVLGMFRRTLPDIKKSIYKRVAEHLEGDFTESDVKTVESHASFAFANGSNILSRSWADKRYSKMRSVDLSSAMIEELSENDSEEFNSFYREILGRIGRVTHIKERFLISATNPDSPEHAIYDYFFLQKHPNRFVFHSTTEDNPFLPPGYVDTLKRTLTKQEIERYIHGRWVALGSKVIYYAYNPEKSHIPFDYEVNEKHPIYIAYDFNIALNKPMSAVLYQWIEGYFHFFDEVVIHSARTLDTLEDLNARGYFDYPCKYIIQGDATGKNRNTRSKKSDYDVIRRYLANLENSYGPLNFEIDVPKSNPPVRTRHTIVNGQLENAYGQTFVYVYKECKTLHKGLQLTKLKKGADYVEDDSKPWQHITTAMGYGIHKTLNTEVNRFTRTKVN